MDKESIEQFLARGGTIIKYKPVSMTDKRPYSRYKMKDLDQASIIAFERKRAVEIKRARMAYAKKKSKT